VFVTAYQRNLSWAKWILHLISLRNILILSFSVYLGLPNGLLSSGLQTRILYAFVMSLMRATCPTYFVLDFIGLFWDENKLWSCILWKFCQLPATSSVLDSSTLLCTLWNEINRDETAIYIHKNRTSHNSEMISLPFVTTLHKITSIVVQQELRNAQ
jgi:hypothetical protein